MRFGATPDQTAPRWVKLPVGPRAAPPHGAAMKNRHKKIWVPPEPRVHESRDDRSRTWAGKTKNSKVRSEGRTLAAAERSADVKRGYQAAETKSAV